MTNSQREKIIDFEKRKEEVNKLKQELETKVLRVENMEDALMKSQVSIKKTK